MSGFASGTAAGSKVAGDQAFQTHFHKYVKKLLQRGDGILRIGYLSEGADLMIELAWQRRLAVYRSLEEITSVL